MKQFTLLLALLVATCLSSFAEAPIKVLRTASDRQIKEIEKQVFKQYGTKVAIIVISRNDKKEITNLKAVRYGKTGEQSGSCSSDKFGILLIKADGCAIADLGYEKDIIAQYQ